MELDMGAIALRPELLEGPSPFIKENAPFVPFPTIGAKLLRAPLKDIRWQLLSPQHRETYIARFEDHFVPHRGLFQPFADLQMLFRMGLVRRNPLRLDERTRTLRVANAKSLEDLLLCDPLDGGGGIWDGMTGTGRSSLLKRSMQIICPDRVIPMGSCKAYGWDNLVHVPYVYVDFAPNGSRGGILKRILFALDQLLGTSLSDDFRKVTNIETLTIEVVRQLSNIRCVLLIIDEKQERNFEDSPWRLEFVLFYLTLMNMGINVLLLGNPLAFSHLETFSQVMRRFSKAGHHHFNPAIAKDEPWWHDDYMPRIRKFNLAERWDMTPEARQQLEFDYSGGLSAFGPAIHTYAQLAAIRRLKASDTEVTVTADDFKSAANSPQYIELLKIKGALLGEGDASALYLDLPNAPARGAGTPADTRCADPAAAVKAVSPADMSMAQRLLSRYMAQMKREANDVVARLKSVQALSDDERKMLHITEAHIDEMRRTVELQQAKMPTKGTLKKS